MNMPLPWERQPQETSAQYHAFITFRDLPPLERSTSRICSELPKLKPKSVDQWRVLNQWYDRAQAWDEEQDRVRREATLQRTIKEAERVAEDAGHFQHLLSRASKEFQRRFSSDDMIEREDAEQELRNLSVPQLIQLSVIAARPFLMMWEAQREAYGITQQHLLVQESRQVEDPFQTDDEFAEKVMEAWREAGVFPKESGDVVEKPSEPLELESGEAVPRVRHRRRSSLPRGRVDDGRGGPGAGA